MTSQGGILSLIAAPHRPILDQFGIGLGVAHAHPIAVFLTCFPAIIPLAGIVSDATETISEKQRNRKWLGSFLNASFGNATELIISIIALFQGQTDITKLSLLGSVFSNLLVVLPTACIIGAPNFIAQNFNINSSVPAFFASRHLRQPSTLSRHKLKETTGLQRRVPTSSWTEGERRRLVQAKVERNTRGWEAEASRAFSTVRENLSLLLGPCTSDNYHTNLLFPAAT
ncbi:Sodium/calcium exchanger protein-domain-containing protein [Mycena olivaceomarginata]|nr:Sodium/calcium exchanger protein-domain-containing protein [Mycena olivaceomarginata]